MVRNYTTARVAEARENVDLLANLAIQFLEGYGTGLGYIAIPLPVLIAVILRIYG